MYNDLAQISKAKGIYRTLSLLAVLSAKHFSNGNSKPPIKNGGNEQVVLNDRREIKVG